MTDRPRPDLTESLGRLRGALGQLQGLGELLDAAGALARGDEDAEARLEAGIVKARSSMPSELADRLEQELRTALDVPLERTVERGLRALDGEGEPVQLDAAGLRRRAALAERLGLDTLAEPFDLGEALVQLGHLGEAAGLTPEQVLHGLRLGVRRYEHDRKLEG